MSTGTFRESHDVNCDQCGRADAYAFDGHSLCFDCYQERGSSCGGGPVCDKDECTAPIIVKASAATAVQPPTASDTELHKVNPNCCYQGCRRCSSVCRLREFQARYPHDWPARLRGLPRIVELARQRV